MTINEEQFAKVRSSLYTADDFLIKLENDFKTLRDKRTRFFERMGVSSLSEAQSKISAMKSRLETVQAEIITEAIECGLVDDSNYDSSDGVN